MLQKYTGLFRQGCYFVEETCTNKKGFAEMSQTLCLFAAQV